MYHQNQKDVVPSYKIPLPGVSGVIPEWVIMDRLPSVVNRLQFLLKPSENQLMEKPGLMWNIEKWDSNSTCGYINLAWTLHWQNTRLSWKGLKRSWKQKAEPNRRIRFRSEHQTSTLQFNPTFCTLLTYLNSHKSAKQRVTRLSEICCWYPPVGFKVVFRSLSHYMLWLFRKGQLNCNVKRGQSGVKIICIIAV